MTFRMMAPQRRVRIFVMAQDRRRQSKLGIKSVSETPVGRGACDLSSRNKRRAAIGHLRSTATRGVGNLNGSKNKVHRALAAASGGGTNSTEHSGEGGLVVIGRPAAEKTWSCRAGLPEFSNKKPISCAVIGSRPRKKICGGRRHSLACCLDGAAASY